MDAATTLELAKTKKSIYFYDKITGKVINCHSHHARRSDGSGFDPADCDEELVQKLLAQTGPGGAYEFLLQKVTENKIENLGYVLEIFKNASTSQLCINATGEKAALSSKPYLQLSLISPEATFLESERMLEKWSFDSDGETPLLLKVEARSFTDAECLRKDDDTKVGHGFDIQAIVSHGRLNPKNGQYTLVNGECEIEWILPNESIEDAKIFVRDFHTKYEKSDFVGSNTVVVRCY